ncbi:MAG: lysylphosphatidylglycerol synthase transmembrane domain-containing protein [Pseudolabrys sp.]
MSDAPSSPPRRLPRIATFLLKAAISAALIYLAFRSINLTDLRERLVMLSWPPLAAALGLLIIQTVAVALRWQQIAYACEINLSPRRAVAFTFIGALFNQTLPSTIGGDAARIWLSARTARRWSDAVASVIADRIAGLMWLSVIVLVALPWSLPLIGDPIAHVALALIGVGGALGPACLYIAIHFGKRLFDNMRWQRAIAVMSQGLRAIVGAFTALPVGGFSLFVHLTTIAAVWLIAQAISSPLALSQAFLLVPPVVLIAAIPLSVAGWGIREGAMLAAFGYAGLPAADGLAVSLLLGAKMFAVGALGGIAWIVTDTQRKPTALAQAE